MSSTMPHLRPTTRWRQIPNDWGTSYRPGSPSLDEGLTAACLCRRLWRSFSNYRSYPSRTLLRLSRSRPTMDPWGVKAILPTLDGSSPLYRLTLMRRIQTEDGYGLAGPLPVQPRGRSTPPVERLGCTRRNDG